MVRGAWGHGGGGQSPPLAYYASACSRLYRRICRWWYKACFLGLSDVSSNHDSAHTCQEEIDPRPRGGGSDIDIESEPKLELDSGLDMDINRRHSSEMEYYSADENPYVPDDMPSYEPDDDLMEES